MLGVAKRTQRLNTQPARDTVVQRLGDDLGPHLEERLIHDDHVTDLDLVLGGFTEAGVDEELVDLGDLLSVLGAGDVNRTPAGVHDGLQIAAVRADKDATRKEVPGIEAAHRQDVEKAFLGDMVHHEADLVHVRQQHNRRRVLVRTGF